MNREKPDRISIGRGIGLNFVENDRYKTNHITFYFVTKLNKYTASYNTVLSRVLTRGCEEYPDQRSLNGALDHCYDAEIVADTSKIGDLHALSVSLSLLDNAYSFDGEDITGEGLSLLEKVLFYPYVAGGAFDEEYVRGEKKLAQDEIASQINHKASYAKGRLIGHMCRLEPYGTGALGEKREIGRITAKSLYEYYEELLETATVEIFFVGRFDREKVKSTVEAIFKDRKRNPEELPQHSIRTKARSVKEITERMDITQANLVMGFRAGVSVFHKDWRAMTLYNSVLGGSLTSKLFCVLREKMSLCYSVSSQPHAMKGILLIYAGIAPENRDVAVKEALRQMDEIKNGNVTAEELENARGAIVHALKGLGDNPAALAGWYLPNVLIGQVKTPTEVMKELEKVTLDDVVRVARGITLDTVYTLTAKEERK